MQVCNNASTRNGLLGLSLYPTFSGFQSGVFCVLGAAESLRRVSNKVESVLVTVFLPANASSESPLSPHILVNSRRHDSVTLVQEISHGVLLVPAPLRPGWFRCG